MAQMATSEWNKFGSQTLLTKEAALNSRNLTLVHEAFVALQLKLVYTVKQEMPLSRSGR